MIVGEGVRHSSLRLLAKLEGVAVYHVMLHQLQMKNIPPVPASTIAGLKSDLLYSRSRLTCIRLCAMLFTVFIIGFAPSPCAAVPRQTATIQRAKIRVNDQLLRLRIAFPANFRAETAIIQARHAREPSFTLLDIVSLDATGGTPQSGKVVTTGFLPARRGRFYFRVSAISKDREILHWSRQKIARNRHPLSSFLRQMNLSRCSRWMADETITATNAERAAAGIPLVHEESHLRVAALSHAAWMASHNILSHEGWLSRVTQTAFQPNEVAQNIARFISDPTLLVSLWYESAEHRANLLNESSSLVGVACVQDAAGGVWWAQNFASASH